MILERLESLILRFVHRMRMFKSNLKFVQLDNIHCSINYFLVLENCLSYRCLENLVGKNIWKIVQNKNCGDIQIN